MKSFFFFSSTHLLPLYFFRSYFFFLTTQTIAAGCLSSGVVTRDTEESWIFKCDQRSRTSKVPVPVKVSVIWSWFWGEIGVHLPSNNRPPSHTQELIRAGDPLNFLVGSHRSYSGGHSLFLHCFLHSLISSVPSRRQETGDIGATCSNGIGNLW